MFAAKMKLFEKLLDRS